MRLKHLVSSPVVAGLNLPADDGEPDWPRYIRTTDIAGPETLADDVVRVAPAAVGDLDVRAGDLLFTRTGSLGTTYLHMSNERAAFAGYLVRVRPDPRRADPRWLSYAARSAQCQRQIAQGAIRSTIDNFNATKIGNLEVPDVPLDAQREIAEFLDRECARIDDALAEIAAQRRAVEELAGVAFGGLVAGMPQAPLRRFIRSLSDGPFGSSLASAHYVDSEETRVIRLGNVGCARFVDGDRVYVADRYAGTVLREHVVAEGDLIIAGLGDTNQPLGRACVVPDKILPAVHKADCYRAQIDTGKCMAQYLALALTYGSARQAAELLSRGATRSRLNTSIARDLPIPVVALDEQRVIVDACDLTMMRSSTAVRELSDLANVLVEYRGALITEAVTGQLDVTRLSDTQMDERLDEVGTGERTEVVAS